MVLIQLFQGLNGQQNGNHVVIQDCSDPYTYPLPYTNSCEFVLARCGSVPALFNYLQFVFCDMEHQQADNYFVPPLNFLSEKLKLSPSIAGITLLAIGNGAPDVFTAYAAIRKAHDFPLELGALLGASIFISTVVLGAVIMVSRVERSTINPVDFFRDVIAYMIVVLAVIIACLDGAIYIYESVIILLLYILYIIVVVIISKKKIACRAEPGLNERSPLLQSGPDSYSEDDDIVYLDDNLTTNLPGLSWPSKSHFLVKIQWLFEWPFSLLRWMSIPVADGKWDPWRRFFVIISPAPMAYVILLAAKGFEGFTLPVGHLPLWIFILILGAGASVILWITTSSRHPPPSWFQFVLMLLAFAMSIVWLQLLPNEVVAVTESLGYTFNIKTVILGFTVLAIGNSLGDLVADTAVARAGKPATGVASCFGSPLLNDVLGLGISLTAYCIQNYPHPLVFDINSEDFVKVKLSWIFLGISLCGSAVVFPFFKYSPPKVTNYNL
ncbi:uncharacterized protein TRIADDRAFT_53673 [Trichoplax adhaerens]|uniref:Sodium/calcium exchanger membrane region domain-containing protein n=1 Tax=Trichoplax adhaerens TaxID=10228 RepID=B3RPV1_TRIAD|nr:hypothetical protein TRIADDRAFT_53673 [Trichoplax adhaerens]EDV27705.1 hypothetical protein TRIADDRAFT_53673 [Trichoplax adhaerens]|eukprot:XP_002109539.1 hypothetical protein TRIADDRAFT_53673 [Trichoplax adhaerens]